MEANLCLRYSSILINGSLLISLTYNVLVAVEAFSYRSSLDFLWLKVKSSSIEKNVYYFEVLISESYSNNLLQCSLFSSLLLLPFFSWLSMWYLDALPSKLRFQYDIYFCQKFIIFYLVLCRQAIELKKLIQKLINSIVSYLNFLWSEKGQLHY